MATFFVDYVHKYSMICHVISRLHVVAFLLVSSSLVRLGIPLSSNSSCNIGVRQIEVG
jgi:hypothetical protein